MNKLFVAALAVGVATSSHVWAFDFGSMVTGAIKDAVTDAAKDMAKDTAKSTAKEVAASQGIDGADKYIDVAVDNADGVNNLSGLSAGGAGWVAANQAVSIAGGAVTDAVNGTQTGDANLDGKVDQYDVRQARVNAAMAHLNSCKSSDAACREAAYQEIQAASGNVEPAAGEDGIQWSN